MTGEIITETPNSEAISSSVTAILSEMEGPQSKVDFIQRTIVPTQDFIMGRKSHLTAMEISSRLLCTDPLQGGLRGEFIELSYELTKSNYKLTPGVALEIADIFYYMLQPNSPYPTEDSWPFGFLLDILEINFDTAYDFCIVKYLTRIELDQCRSLDKSHKKAIEMEVMARFLQEGKI